MKKFTTRFLALALLLLLAVAAVGCGSSKITDFAIDDAKVTKTLTVGDGISVGSLKATVTFKNGKQQDLTAKELEFYHGETKLSGTVFTGLTETAGEVEITVKYQSFTKTIKFTVKELVAQSLELSSTGTTVKVGNLIEVGALTATVTFNNTTKKTLAATDLEFYNGETKLNGTVFADLTKTAGQVVITAKYLTVSATYTVTVEERVPQAFAIDASGKQMEVKEGDVINLGSLKTTVTYDDETSGHPSVSDLSFYIGENKLEGTVFTGLTETVGGDPIVITVKYLTFTDTVTVTVKELVAVSLELQTANVPWVELGGTAEFGSITAAVIFENGDSKPVALSEIAFFLADETPLELSAENEVADVWTTAGTITITAKYNGLQTTFGILVKDIATATGIVLDDTGVSTEIEVGSDIDVRNLGVFVTFSDETREALNLNKVLFYCGGTQLTGTVFADMTADPGEIFIAVKYLTFDEQTLCFKVDNHKAQEFAVDTEEMTKTFTVGQDIDFTGMTATATLENDEQKTPGIKDIAFYLGETRLTLNAKNKVSGISTTAGTLTITAKYRDKSQDIILTIEKVEAQTLTLNSAGVKTDVKVGEAIDVGNLKATVAFNFGDPQKFNVKALKFFYGSEELTGRTVFSNLTGKTGTVEITVQYTVQETDSLKGTTLSATLSIKIGDLVAQTLTLKNTDDLKAVIDTPAYFGNITGTVTFDFGDPAPLLASDPGLRFFQGTKELTLNNGYVSGITKEIGTVTITAKYKDSETAVATFELEVISVYSFMGFESSNETDRKTSAKNFLDKNADAETRLVGDDNEFRFEPVLTVYDHILDDLIEISRFETVAEITIKDGGKLKAENESAHTTAYYQGETLIATAYNKEGKYQFTSDAIGNTYVISVQPKDYKDKSPAVSVTVKIVDGYNVYDAKDLAIIDNSTSKDWAADDRNGGWADNPDVWADIRDEKGFTLEQINETKAVILQNDITITENDLPDAYVGTVERPLQYYNLLTGTLVKTVWGAKRLTHDDNGHMALYERTSGSDFAFYGNYYTLDGSQVPLVSAFDEDAVETNELGRNLTISNYGGDTSNASLFYFKGDKTNAYKIENVNVIGNADASQWVIYKKDDENRQNPGTVNAGGFIFSKANGCSFEVNNSNMITCFIGYLIEENTVATVNYTKVKSCYQDAAFLYGACDVTVKNSELTETGGPLFILQHPLPDTDPTNYPTLTIVDSTMENYVTGHEMWFSDKKVDSLVNTIKAISDGFVSSATENKTATKTISPRPDCLNLICLIMSDGVDGTDAMTGIETQGCCKIQVTEKDNDGNPVIKEEYVLDRRVDSPTGYSIRGPLSQSAPVFNVDDVLETGMCYYGGEAYGYIYAVNEDGLKSAVENGDFISLNYGGMGLMLGTFSK